MWKNQNIDNVRNSNQQRYARISPRVVGRPNAYQNFRNRMDNRDPHLQYRKHNSPDMNRFRQNPQPRTNTNYQNPQNQYPSANGYRKYRGTNETQQQQPTNKYARRQRQDTLPPQNNTRDKQISNNRIKNKDLIKGKQLTRNSSSPNFTVQERERKQQEQQEEVENQNNQDYLRLHEKLNFIQAKIADMKKHVQKKKQQKLQIIQAKKRRQQEKQQQRRLKQQQQATKKVDLKQFITQVPQHQQLHSFQNNPYSPKHGIYYVSQIIKSYKDQKSIGRQHLLTSLHILKILENSRFASEEEMMKRQVKLPRRQGYQGKKSVIFDLDQTLIHCNDTLTPPYDVKLPITFPTGQVIQAGINIRPYAFQILKNLAPHFEVIVFTASHSCYANVVLDYFDPEHQYIHHRLYRQHCYQTPEGIYCKDLRVIDRSMKDMVLVDNAAYSYAAQLDNGIPIIPYYHGKHDYELKALESYLLKMVMLNDVRSLNRRTFQLHNYRNYYHDAEGLVEDLYIKEENQ